MNATLQEPKMNARQARRAIGNRKTRKQMRKALRWQSKLEAKPKNK